MFALARRVLAAIVLAGVPPAFAQQKFSLFVGTPPDLVNRMVKLAGLRDGEVAVDLGSGDGRIPLAAVLTHDNVRAWGVDINRALVDMANRFAYEENVVDRLRFVHGDVFDVDLRRVDVIFMWLFPELQRLLRPKILAEARPGTRIVTNMFDMGSWRADEIDTERPQIRKWIVPARVEGDWTWTLNLRGRPQRYVALIEQRFQMAEGVVRVGALRRELREVELKGARLSFVVAAPFGDIERVVQRFEGTVRGDRITGRVRLVVPAPDVEPGTPPEETPAEAVPERELFALPWVAQRRAGGQYLAGSRNISALPHAAVRRAMR
jgi:hypothetical protein